MRTAGDQTRSISGRPIISRNRIKGYANRGIDINDAIPPGGHGLNKQDPNVMKLMNQHKQVILSIGQFPGQRLCT